MEKKKRILEIELEIAREMKKRDIIAECIDNSIADSIKNIFNLLKRKQEMLSKFSTLYDEEYKNADSDLIKIINYKKGEMIQFGTNLLPPNMYKLESYISCHDLKNRIKYAIKDKLSEFKEVDEDGHIIDIWDRAILIIEVFKEGQIADFDNYFIKPYVDGIVLSRFVYDDSARNLKVFYSPLDLKDYIVKFTLINQKYSEKYEDYLLDIYNK